MSPGVVGVILWQACQGALINKIGTCRNVEMTYSVDPHFCFLSITTAIIYNLLEKQMSLLWIMGGLTVVALAILNLLLIRKYRTERQQRLTETELNKEQNLIRNCERYHLSNREADVLRHILAGHTYRSAAEELFISQKTVDAHLRKIYAKSGVKNKVELVVKFYS
ncbi:helix-turn-helix transcriptional regulator [Mucilaginibacter defluvii]|uniref:HTH luxR-type domain-containing protein n=1 Tax=Mucilaginibacter defluvii TaxID=1196019 RepID=A0ABP9FPG5_9SPHI